MSDASQTAKYIALLLLVALLLTGCLGGRRQGVEPLATFAAVGSVHSRTEGLPIPGAVVTVNDRQAKTDDQGRFTLANMPRRNGYADYSVSAAGYYRNSGSQPITGDILELHFTLTPMSALDDGAVYGTVNFTVPAFSTGDCPVPAPQPRQLRSVSPLAPEELQPSDVIVQLLGPPTPEAASRLMQATGAPSFRIAPYIERLILKVPAGVAMETFIEQLLAQPEVVDAYPDEPAFLLAEPYLPNDPCFNVQHHLHQVNAPMAWNVTTGAPDIVVAVLDTGVDALHQDLQANLLPGWNAYTGEDDVHDRSNVGHGTHVAGIIGAVTNNGRGVAGMAWNVSMLPVKVIEGRTGTASAVAAGIRYAVEAGADIINMSLGIPNDAPDVRAAIEYAAANGVILVAAAGNTGMGLVTTAYPARYEEVIGVGATAKGVPTEAAGFSLHGPGIDVVAPGEGVWSTVPFGYNNMSGTSMAAPVVSGIAALMLAQGIPPWEVRDVLQRTAVRIGEPTMDLETRHTFGYGLVNAYAAVLNLDLQDAVVFAMDGQGVIYGDVAFPDAERRFVLTELPVHEGLHVVGWLDVNGDGALNAGDYFAMVPLSPGNEKVDLQLDVYPNRTDIELSLVAAEAIMNLALNRSVLP